MTQHNQQSGNEHHSVKYLWDPQKGAPTELSDPVHAGNAPTASRISNTRADQTDSNPSQVLTTGQLVYAIGQIWSYAKHPPSGKSSFANRELVFASSQSDGVNGTTCESNKGQEHIVGYPHQKLQSKPDVAAFSDIADHGFSSPIGNGIITATEFLDEKIFSGVRISKELRNVYTWMSHSYSSGNSMRQQRHTIMKLDSNVIDCTVQNDSKGSSSSDVDTEKTSVTVNMVSSKTSDSKPATNIHNNFFQGDEIDLGDMETNISAAECSKPQISPVKQQQAVAGAMAGICVSLCLHPVDTVKTVVQSCRLDQKSIFDIGRSIVSERGLRGLYRGIASNLASSAPVSALYTFTYESVKGVLLPLFPKEYCSVAHCMAGGCASVATSFIFTPSECIKQQMQVRSKYQNCWIALIGIVQKGGLASLYAGWGAVICRNVPHSIIKFYTYENLKQSMMSSLQCSELDTLQTLACGAVAGSTAALFSTPFDVVKTRLQTQVPGSEYQYRGVFLAIQAIRMSEGFRGLYRGLAPRLIMYMSQGGLFFASYEFFKRSLGLGPLGALQHSN